MKPSDATHIGYGSYYKVGAYGFFYRWRGTEWVKSNLTDTKRQKVLSLEEAQKIIEGR